MFWIKASQLHDGDRRLDAAYFHGRWALTAVEQSGFPVQQLGEVAKISFPNRFKRGYIAGGIPFVGSREMFFWPLRPERAIAVQPELQSLFVRRGTILVSRSGTVGESTIASDEFVGVAITEHALRVETSALEPEYVYAFLASRFGKALLRRTQFGAVVSELSPGHLAEIPVPIVHRRDRNEIIDLVGRSLIAQEGGAKSVRSADQAMLRLLPPFPTVLPEYIGDPATTRLRAFTVHAAGLNDRLDVSFHLPEVRWIDRALQSTGYQTVNLNEVAQIVIPGRFKRIYVDASQGVPLMQGSHVPMRTPSALKYISRSANAKQLSTHAIHPGQVLVTCSGTLGRTTLATRAIAGWAASQHIARIVPVDGVRGGFIAAFLSSAYGQQQILAQTYGAVIDELSEAQLGSVRVFLPPEAAQNEIGDLMEAGFRLRDEANDLERQAVSTLEDLIATGA